MKTGGPKKGTSNKVYLTSQGLESLKSELQFLKNIKRKDIADRIESARQADDDEENSEYDAALEQQTIMESKIIQIEEAIGSAKLIDKQVDFESVEVGSTVRVNLGGKIDEFMIVGKLEANPTKKKISNESPVGSALLGGKVGQEIEITTPDLSYRCKILNIT